MAAEDDVPLGDAARHYEQKFGAKVRQVRKDGARPPAGGGGSGTGRTAIGLIVVIVIVVVRVAFMAGSSRHSTPSFTFSQPQPQINFEQQRKVFEDLERAQREMEQAQRRAWQPVPPGLLGHGPEPSYRFEAGDVPLPEGLCDRIVREAAAAAPFNPGKRVHQFLDPEARELVRRAARGEDLGAVERDELRAALNEVLDRADFYFAPCFADVGLPGRARPLAERRTAGRPLTVAETRKLNRLALEAAYPRQIIPAEDRESLGAAERQLRKEFAREDLAAARQQDAAGR